MSDAGAITLRPAVAEDRPFLLQVYTESRADELAATGWTDGQKEAFCQSQFEAQDLHYRQHYRTCAFLVIERDGQPIGRLYRDRRADEIRVVDIALLASERGLGVGGRILQDIQAEAAASGLLVRIHVERTNPARRLYDRLGFRPAGPADVYDLLTWDPSC